MTTLSHVYMTHAVLFPVLIIKQRTLFIHEKHKKLPIQSTVSLWFMGTNQEIKIKFKNSNKSNPEENTVLKLIYTTLIQYCSLRREHYKHVELAWTGIPPLFTLTGFIFTPRNQTDYFSFSPTLVSMATELLNLVLKRVLIFWERCETGMHPVIFRKAIVCIKKNYPFTTVLWDHHEQSDHLQCKPGTKMGLVCSSAIYPDLTVLFGLPFYDQKQRKPKLFLPPEGNWGSRKPRGDCRLLLLHGWEVAGALWEFKCIKTPHQVTCSAYPVNVLGRSQTLLLASGIGSPKQYTPQHWQESPTNSESELLSLAPPPPLFYLAREEKMQNRITF